MYTESKIKVGGTQWYLVVPHRYVSQKGNGGVWRLDVLDIEYQTPLVDYQSPRSSTLCQLLGGHWGTITSTKKWCFGGWIHLCVCLFVLSFVAVFHFHCFSMIQWYLLISSDLRLSIVVPGPAPFLCQPANIIYHSTALASAWTTSPPKLQEPETCRLFLKIPYLLRTKKYLSLVFSYFFYSYNMVNNLGVYVNR